MTRKIYSHNVKWQLGTAATQCGKVLWQCKDRKKMCDVRCSYQATSATDPICKVWMSGDKSLGSYPIELPGQVPVHAVK